MENIALKFSEIAFIVLLYYRMARPCVAYIILCPLSSKTPLWRSAKYIIISACYSRFLAQKVAHTLQEKKCFNTSVLKQRWVFFRVHGLYPWKVYCHSLLGRLDFCLLAVKNMKGMAKYPCLVRVSNPGQIMRPC